MKRRSVTFFILVVFLTWNVTTYMFLAYNKPQGKQLESDEEGVVHHRLAELQERLKEQVDAHESILRDLEQARVDLQAELLHKQQQQQADNDKSPGRSPQGGALVAPEAPDGHNPQAPDPAAQMDSSVIPILVIACNRPSINRNLDQLLKYRPSADKFPIVVSQDCGHGPTADMIRSYGDKLTHLQQPDLSEIPLPKKEEKFKGYYKIARHYKWALQQVFHELEYEVVVIVEDDLDISPDFYEYFAATYPILHSDPTLWCVSAWNDNGKENMVADEPEKLYRTDFFPGLGWMLEKSVWMELENNWPPTFWDDWMRHPDQRKERSCIRPEVPRTSTFGKVGVSKGQYFEKHLKFIKHNTKHVPFTQMDLSYLKKEPYDEAYVRQVYGAPLLTVAQVISSHKPDAQEVRVQYSDKTSFKTQAKQLGIMDDFKSGVPRAGYRGVVSLMYRGRRVYFAPPPDWRGYDPTWS